MPSARRALQWRRNTQLLLNSKHRPFAPLRALPAAGQDIWCEFPISVSCINHIASAILARDLRMPLTSDGLTPEQMLKTRARRHELISSELEGGLVGHWTDSGRVSACVTGEP
jgi:hypothetical protein